MSSTASNIDSSFAAAVCAVVLFFPVSIGHGSPASAKALQAMVFSTDSDRDSFFPGAAGEASPDPFPVLMGHGSPASAKALHAMVSSTDFNAVFFSSMDKSPIIDVWGFLPSCWSQYFSVARWHIKKKKKYTDFFYHSYQYNGSRSFILTAYLKNITLGWQNTMVFIFLF
ncbi:MAG: hypothetical protein Q7U64_01505 [Desulfocapsaceae bacterium]|nr:hypothetical protein [Desulfocapsaceae bacterium]